VLLGVLMQLALLVFSGLTPLAPFVAEMSQKISWATIVCVGIAVGGAAARSIPAAGGLAGLIAAPLGFVGAKVVHKSLTQALAAGPVAEQPTVLFVTLIILKALEYGILGYILSRFVAKKKRYLLFLGTGLLLGLITCPAILTATITLSAKVPPTPKLLALGANELLFPLGCSTVVFVAAALTRAPAKT
jgi:hypothetical protein